MSVCQCPLSLRLLVLATVGVLNVPWAWAQASSQMPSPERPSTLVISLRSPDGSPLDSPAVVNLYSFGGAPAGIGLFRSGTVEFSDLAPANYTLDVIAAGYKRLTEDVQILAAGERQQLSIGRDVVRVGRRDRQRLVQGLFRSDAGLLEQARDVLP